MRKETLHTSLVDLKPVADARLPEAAKALALPHVRELLDLNLDCTAEVLKSRIAKRELGLWEIWPPNAKSLIGYAGWRATGGPYLFFVPLEDKFNAEVVQEVTVALVDEFFVHDRPTLEPWAKQACLFIHVPRQIEEAMHSFLVENGFDPMEKHQSFSSNDFASYLLHPDTYEAYHSEEEDA